MCAAGPSQGEPAPSTPDPSRSASLSFSAVPGPAGTRFGLVRRFAEIDSTNRYVLDEARAGAAEGVVAVADYQSAGRGRLGRRWEAPPRSNLLVSVLLRPTVSIEQLHLCTVAVALAAARACERGAGVIPDLKWPNDLMVGRRKLGGILAEVVPAGNGPTPAVVVGLGLNVGWPPRDEVGWPIRVAKGGSPSRAETVDIDETGTTAPADLDEVLAAATSLGRETGADPDPLVLLGLMLQELEGRVRDLADRVGRGRLAGEYRRRCVTVGKTVRVSLPGEEFTGTATDITAEGHLVVDTGAGLKTVAAGDVVHLREPG
jgi:BirA family biotin operon repressor/biotin-[acetyl-CoA-carboxylase] ligase